MDLSIFGWNLNGKKPKVSDVEPVEPSIINPELDDGTTVSSSSAAYYGYYVDLDGSVTDEIQSIQKCREIAMYPDVDIAIQDIVDEAIPYEDSSKLVELRTDGLDEDIPENIKEAITDNFEYVLKMLKFNERASDIFRKWYIDGRLFYNVILDKQTKNGISELRPIESTKIKKVAEVIKEKTPEGVEIVKGLKEYFLYSQVGFVANAAQNNSGASQTSKAVKMTLDSVVYTPSGFNDQTNGMVCSYLQKALRSANQLRLLEDAVVIYRLARAPERRIFYVDVGNLPKAKAEQYVKDIMNKYRNKLVYDAKTGNIRDDKKYMSMLEDFWMPRRDGGKGTEITTLPGGQNLGEMTDVEYFKEKLYAALNIPLSRLQSESGFNIGRSTEVTRDEVKFQKFIQRLRRKFSELLFDLLKIQLITTGVISEEDWDDIKEKLSLRFQKDNFFSELKEQDILLSRMNIALQAEQLIGKYFSVDWISKNVFKMSDEEIQEQLAKIDEEYAEHPWWFQQQQMYDQQQQMNMQSSIGMMPEGQPVEPQQ